MCPCASGPFQHLEFLLRIFFAPMFHGRLSPSTSLGRPTQTPVVTQLAPGTRPGLALPTLHVSVSAWNRNRGDATAVHPCSLSIRHLAPLTVRPRAARQRGNSGGRAESWHSAADSRCLVTSLPVCITSHPGSLATVWAGSLLLLTSPIKRNHVCFLDYYSR